MRERLIALRVALGLGLLPTLGWFAAMQALEIALQLQLRAGWFYDMPYLWPRTTEFLVRAEEGALEFLLSLMGYALWERLVGWDAAFTVSGVLVWIHWACLACLFVWQWRLGRRWRRLRALL